MREYRLTWETADPQQCAAMEYSLGKDCWPRVDFDSLKWHKSGPVLFTSEERLDQYRNLKAWADSHEQPIRNVLLEQREVPTDGGWTPATNDLFGEVE